jgi:hypothetical protein
LNQLKALKKLKSWLEGRRKTQRTWSSFNFVLKKEERLTGALLSPSYQLSE